MRTMLASSIFGITVPVVRGLHSLTFKLNLRRV